MEQGVTAVVEDFVATVELHRPPDNFFDAELMTALADTLESLGDEPSCRAIVLCSEGRNFCAGADLASKLGAIDRTADLYAQAVRIVAAPLPIVAAVQGAAVGGGLGLALAADFRVAGPATRFGCNFARLAFHHGFGLTVTLPAVVGRQRALELLYTGGSVKGAAALAIGLCDRLVPDDEVRAAAHAFAAEIAASGPLAVRAIRATMLADLPERMRAATEREHAEQQRLRSSDDFREGVAAMTERRPPRFTGR